MSTAAENFEEAFDDHVGSARAQCACGHTFYNPGSGWDWEEREIAGLEADPTATALDWSVGYITLEGATYCRDCNCWKPRAEQIRRFIDAHARKIAEYLTLEKKRKTEAASASAVVE